MITAVTTTAVKVLAKQFAGFSAMTTVATTTQVTATPMRGLLILILAVLTTIPTPLLPGAILLLRLEIHPLPEIHQDLQEEAVCRGRVVVTRILF
jgi:hypothetical protein